MRPPATALRDRPAVRAAACGAVAALGLQPFGFWPATVLALAFGLSVLAAAPTRAAAFRAGLLLGTGWFAVALSWIVEPFLIAAPTRWMAAPALALIALGGGLFWAVPAWAAARLFTGGRRVLALALALTAAEALRAVLLTGFPWAQPGQVWVGTPVAQIAALAGQLGLTAFTFGAAATAILAHRRTGPGAAALVLAAPFALAALYGAQRLAAPEPAEPGVLLRLVQPDAEQALKWDPVWQDEFYRRLLDLSAGPAAGERRPDAVIWPETAVPFLLNDAGPLLPEMAESADGAPLLTGVQRAEELRWWNSLAEIRPDGTVGAIYDKVHLVPFGEYIPLGNLLARFGIGAFAARNGFGYTAGPGMRVLHVAGLPPFQPLICYEAVFGRHLRAVDADWTLQVTNDAWFGRFSGPFQHLAQAQLRAIESGRPLIRVANTGVSAVIDARGRIRQSLGLGVLGRIDAALPGRLPPTPWLRLGDAPLLAAMAVAALLLGLAQNRRRRIDRAGPQV